MPDRARTSVFLIGMMGAGKSTVGRLLAADTGLEFVDCDRELERRAGTSIENVFVLEGEAGFRLRENQLLEDLTQRPRVVLATGGGAVLSAENRRLLRSRGLVIYLQASLEEITRRTRADAGRPLLRVADRRAKLQELLAQRAPFYRQTAHLVVRSAAANPRRLVARLLAHPQVAEVIESTLTPGPSPAPPEP
jgi:shikimate kinase